MATSDVNQQTDGIYTNSPILVQSCYAYVIHAVLRWQLITILYPYTVNLDTKYKQWTKRKQDVYTGKFQIILLSLKKTIHNNLFIYQL